MTDRWEKLESVLENPQDFSVKERSDAAAAIIHSKRERERAKNLDRRSKADVLKMLQVSDPQVARAHRKMFPRERYQPVVRNRLPFLNGDDLPGYIPWFETGRSERSLRHYYDTGYLDLGTFQGELYVGRDSWGLYTKGNRKYTPVADGSQITHLEQKDLRSLADVGHLRLVVRGRNDFAYTEDLYKLAEDEWVNISEGARRLGVTREQLRNDVNDAGIEIVKSGKSYLARFSDIKKAFSRISPYSTYVSKARFMHLLNLPDDRVLRQMDIELKTIGNGAQVVNAIYLRRLQLIYALRGIISKYNEASQRLYDDQSAQSQA